MYFHRYETKKVLVVQINIQVDVGVKKFQGEVSWFQIENYS